MNNSNIILGKREVAELKQKRIGKADSGGTPLVVYRIIRDGQEVDCWISGKVAFNIIRPK